MHTDPDQTAPGSDTSTDHGDTDGVATQLTPEDTLMNPDPRDPFDPNYEPPFREPPVDVPTPEEERSGESLDDRVAQERRDPGAGIGSGAEEGENREERSDIASETGADSGDRSVSQAAEDSLDDDLEVTSPDIDREELTEEDLSDNKLVEDLTVEDLAGDERVEDDDIDDEFSDVSDRDRLDEP